MKPHHATHALLPTPIIRHLRNTAACIAISGLGILATRAAVTPGGVTLHNATFINKSIALDTYVAAAGPGALGPDFVHYFTFEEGVTDPTYDLDPTGADTTEIALSSGHHLVLYNTKSTSVTGNNRAEVQSKLNLYNVATTTSTDLAIGRSQGYIRLASGANSTFNTGGAIIEVTDDDDILKMMSFRSDTNNATINPCNPQWIVRSTNEDSTIQLLKLDDSWDYLRLERTVDQAGTVGTSYTAVTYNTELEKDAPTFGFTPGGSDITLNETGLYLVFANTGIRKPNNNTRTAYFQRLTLDGTPINGTTTTTYMKGNYDTDDGVTAIGTLIKVTTAGQVLKVELSKEKGSNSTIIGGSTAISIVKLPITAQHISLRDITEQPVNDSNPVTFILQVDVASPKFSHTVADSNVTINEAGDYLFLGTMFVQDASPNDTTERIVVNHGWQVNGGGMKKYGQGSAYLRDNGSYSAGSWSGAVLESQAIGNNVEMITAPMGNTTVIDPLLQDPGGDEIT